MKSPLNILDTAYRHDLLPQNQQVIPPPAPRGGPRQEFQLEELRGVHSKAASDARTCSPIIVIKVHRVVSKSNTIMVDNFLCLRGKLS